MTDTAYSSHPVEFELTDLRVNTPPEQRKVPRNHMSDVVETEPAIDVEELDAYAPAADLALAERLLAALLVRSWRQSHGKPIGNDTTGASSTI